MRTTLAQHQQSEIALLVARSGDLGAQLKSIVDSAPVGATLEIDLIRVIIHTAASLSASGVETTVAVPSPGTVDPPGSDGLDLARMTALQRVRAYVAHNGDESRKHRDWAGLISQSGGPSGRELQRALEEGLLQCTVKPFGKDAGAQLVDPQDLIGYLTRREQVLAAGDLPQDWKRVVRSQSRPTA